MDCNHTCSTCKRVWNGGCIHSPKRGVEYRIETLFKEESNELHLSKDEEKTSGVYTQTPEKMLKFVELGEELFS